MCAEEKFRVVVGKLTEHRAVRYDYGMMGHPGEL